jgi:hypothetical protein
MKTALTLLLIVLALLASGCTSQVAPAGSDMTRTQAPNIAVPNLSGTWTGTMQGYEEGVGFTDYNKEAITMVVNGQQGRLFSGYLTFGSNTTKKLPLAGVVSRDGRTFTMVEDVNGYTTGEFTGNDEIQLTHIDDAQPYSVALDTLKRV